MMPLAVQGVHAHNPHRRGTHTATHTHTRTHDIQLCYHETKASASDTVEQTLDKHAAVSAQGHVVIHTHMHMRKPIIKLCVCVCVFESVSSVWVRTSPLDLSVSTQRSLHMASKHGEIMIAKGHGRERTVCILRGCVCVCRRAAEAVWLGRLRAVHGSSGV